MPLFVGASESYDTDAWESYNLKKENAKLRNEVDNLLDFEHLTSVAVAYAGCDECGEYKQTMLRLFAENAKLRELIQDFDKCLTEAVRLAYIQGHATIYDGTLLDSLHPRMRELGVEVDG